MFRSGGGQAKVKGEQQQQTTSPRAKPQQQPQKKKGKKKKGGKWQQGNLIQSVTSFLTNHCPKLLHVLKMILIRTKLTFMCEHIHCILVTLSPGHSQLSMLHSENKRAILKSWEQAGGEASILVTRNPEARRNETITVQLHYKNGKKKMMQCLCSARDSDADERDLEC